MSRSYTIDFETIGLNVGLAKSYNNLGRTTVLNPTDAFLQFGHIDVTQFATHDSQSNTINHYGVQFNKDHKIPHFVDLDSKHTRTVKGFGKVDAYHISNYDKKDVEGLFHQPWSKLKGAKSDWYREKILPSHLSKGRSALFKLPTSDGQDIFIAESNLRLGLKSGDLKIKNGRLERGFEELKDMFNQKGISYKENFTYKNFQSFLEKNTTEMLKNASKNNPVTVGAWNPYFDINLYMSELVKAGNPGLAKQLYEAYQNGIIQPNELERAYKAFLFQIGKENPELGNMFRIGYNPIAAAATGRPGQIAKTFNEFQYVGGYKAEQAAEILSRHFGLNLTQGHAAGLDVATELEIQKAIVKEIEKAGLSVDGIIKGDVHGNLSKVLKDNNKLGGVLDDLIKQFKPMAESYSKYPSMFEGSKMAEDVRTAFKGASKLRYGALGAVLSLGMLATYGFGNKDDDLYPFSDRMSIKKLGLPKTPSYSTYFEDKHNSMTQMGTLLGAGILGPAAFFYGVGTYRRLTSPRTLGYSPNLELSAKGIIGTIYRGAKTVEGAHPITRVFQLGSTIDYFAGNRKDTVFKTIREGKLVEANKFRPNEYYHNFAYDNILATAKDLIPEQEYAKLGEMFKPTKAMNSTGKDILTREIRIGTAENGSMIIYSKDYIDGAEQAIENAITIPIKFKMMDSRRANPSMANLINRTGKNYGEKHISNPINYAMIQNDQIKYGRANWIRDFDSWMKTQDVPLDIKNNPEWEWMWRLRKKIQHTLELGPKGVGENRNIFAVDMQKLSSKETKFARITSIIGEGHGLQNSHLFYQNMSRPVHNWMLSRWNRFLESPFEFGLFGLSSNKMDKWANSLKSTGKLVPSMAGKVLSVINRPHLGLAEYNIRTMGFLEYGFKFGMKRILPAMAAWEGIRFADHVLGALTLSPTGRGPIFGAPVAAWQGVSLLYSKISDITGFTKLTKKQEKVAPGSTHLGTLAPALSAIGLYKFGSFMYNKGPMGIRQAMMKAGKRMSQYSLVKNAMRTEAYKGALSRGPLERYLSWGLKNPKKAIFSFMMLPMLPFLPGVLGSNKSYRERKAEFSGDKEVAIRKYRGWLLSSSPYEGGKPIQFRQHMTKIIQSDYENQGVVWPNYWERFLHNVSFGLYKPYILENYHKKDQPVYTSAPLGSNIPLLGQPIAATIGRLIKPTVTYHTLEEGGGTRSLPVMTPGTGLIIPGKHASDMELAKTVGIQDEGNDKDLLNRWSRQYHDLIGFTGFTYETARQYITGTTPGQLTPYREGAGEMYNPAQQMWGWHSGDITGFGGEFLRRLFPYPQKDWKINDIPNELYGVSWIPQESTKKDAFKRYSQDVTHGTTFDNVPLGWLYASRKGWETLYPEVKGKELEQYPDPARLEILQSIAPFTQEFRDQARKVMGETLKNQLSLSDEQRYYETLDQVRQLKDQLYVNKSEYDYSVETENMNGTVSSVDESGAFTLEGDDRKYRLAGVSTSEADIRAHLLLKQKFETTQELVQATEAIKQRTSQLIANKLAVGQSISFSSPEADQMNNAEMGIEAIVGDLNDQLMDAGAPMVNTGNLSEFNIQQQHVGYAGRAMAKYWDVIANNQTFWANKLIPKRDYLTNYLQNQVFNREVKLWSHPFKHIIEPAIATFMHQWFGVDKIPEFTMERRRNQEYWDILKYVKYKMLAVQSAKTGNEEEALYYHNMWRSTMIGSDPTDDNTRDELAALPENERAYYSRFANEPDPKKRGEIMKYIPRGAKRLYSAIWSRKIAESSNDPKVQAQYEGLKATEGWGITPRERKMYMKETGGNADVSDWIRARYVREFMKKHDMPEQDWIGWSADVDIENVELLSLKEGGENIQDYAFFDNKLREAIYDQGANLASHQLKSVGHTSRATMNGIVSYIIQDDRASSIQMFPTSSPNTVTSVNIETNGHQDYVSKTQNQYADLLHSSFSYNY